MKNPSKRKFFVCFERDGVIGILNETWSNDETTFISWLEPVDINFGSLVKKNNVTEIDKGDFPKVDNVANGFCFVVRNYDSNGNFMTDEKDKVQKENKTLRNINKMLERALKQMTSSTGRLTQDKDEEILRTLELARAAGEIVQKKRDDYAES